MASYLIRTLYPRSARSALGRGSGGGLALPQESIGQAISYLGNFL